MPILHPIFMLIFVVLLVGSYYEVFISEKKTTIFIWIAWVLMIIAVGFRNGVGADFPIYRKLFSGFAIYTSYQDVWDKALFRPNEEEIEWIYVLINKVIFDFGLPFYFVTLVMAMISITIKFLVIKKNVVLPTLAVFFYFLPTMFFDDSGQMRQGMGIAFSLLSFKFIKDRNLPMFLVIMYLAIGCHKTAIVFIPAYWIVKIPMNANRIFWVLIIAIILSPLELYRLGDGIFSSLAPQDIKGGFEGYVDDETYGQEVQAGLNDIVKLLMIFLLIKYDKKAVNGVWWYEYMRNLAVFGLFLFYIMRGNSIFAIRLPGGYLFFLYMFCLPSILYVLKDQVKVLIYSCFVGYLTMMFFYFGKGTGDAGYFTIGKYRNALW